MISHVIPIEILWKSACSLLSGRSTGGRWKARDQLAVTWMMFQIPRKYPIGGLTLQNGVYFLKNHEFSRDAMKIYMGYVCIYIYIYGYIHIYIYITNNILGCVWKWATSIFFKIWCKPLDLGGPYVLVGGRPTPMKNMNSSVGMMRFPTGWEN